MTTIRANCLDCGDVELTPEDLTVVYETSSDQHYYRFICPDHGRGPADIVLKESSRRIADLLLSSNVRLLRLDVMAERVAEGLPPEDATKYALTADDLIDFHLALAKATDVEIIENAQVENHRP